MESRTRNKQNNNHKTALPLALQKTVHALFEKQSSEHPCSIVSFKGDACRYADLNKHANAMANQLIWSHSKREEIVAILQERSLAAVASQLAVLKAGGAYLPLSPKDFPLERIKIIFEDAQVNFVITERKYDYLVDALEQDLERGIHRFYVDDQEEQKDSENGNINANIDIDHHLEETLLDEVRVKPSDLAYVMYTSGSTGKPKGVMITHENIVSTVMDTCYFSCTPKDSVLHAAPISFDAATFEIWGALLNGGNLHIINDESLYDLKRFSHFVQDKNIDIAWLTSSLCNLVVDSQIELFKTLRLLLVGGEALSPTHINRIKAMYPSLEIRNNYGPTENTVFSTSYVIEDQHQSSIPIGQTISHKQAFILDNQMRPTLTKQSGQLYVAGLGVARGYLNNPEETNKKFIPNPFMAGELMYATGDLCCYDYDGNIEFLGRIDNQVKIRGHRIELGEIETALLEHKDVELAVAIYKPLTDNQHTQVKGIVAYIKHKGAITDIKQSLEERLPNYMIPNYFETMDSFPISLNGKLDRKLLEELPLKNQKAKKKLTCDAINDETERKSSSKLLDSDLKSAAEKTVIGLVEQVLDIERVDPGANFFDLGGDSMSGTCLIVELSYAFGKEIPLHTLYDKPIINDLIDAIVSQETILCHRVESEKLRADAELTFNHTLPKPGHNPTSKSIAPDPKYLKIFLTGATGFFGAYLLNELLETSQATIFCLVRADNAAHGLERIKQTFYKYKIPVSQAEMDRILAIPGNLEKPFLGLQACQFGELSNAVDIIFHCAASVNYVDTYHQLKPSNVDGTKEILKLSSLNKLTPVHYISSVSVFETVGFFTGKKMIYENESVDSSLNYVKLGYSQSKWVAEKLMENAQAEGLPINIYRTGYIMGHSKTGVSNTTDHIARYIAGCIEMRCAPILDENASLAPVDQLSRALAHIALHNEIKGKTYHLCNPEFTTVSQIYQNIQSFGFELELISYEKWKQRLVNATNSNPLFPLLSLHIHAAPDNELTLPELYERNAKFDCQDFLKALEGSNINIDMSDPSIFEKWLLSYVEAGLISETTYRRAQNTKSSRVNLTEEVVAC